MKPPRWLKQFAMRFSSQGSYVSFLPGGNVDYVRAVGDGTNSSVVMAPVLWACRTFPEAPIMVQRHLDDGTEEEVVGHPLTKLLRRPNPFWSGELMWWATIASLFTTGNGYWIKVRDGQMRVTELWWVPNDMMEPKWPQEGTEFITHYEYKPGGEAIRVDPTDVVHFRYGIDPSNPRLGLSPLASVLREVYTDDEAATYTASILKNMGIPGLIVAPDGDAIVSDDDLLATKEALTKQFSGKNRGRPFIAGAPTKVTQFGFSPQQLDLKTLRRLPEERVTAVTGIPAIVAGLGAGLDRSTFANMAEAREMAYESTMIPLQRLVGSDLGNQIMDDFESSPDLFQIAFDLSQVRVLQEDENAKTDRKLRELTSGAITLAEYRRETNREAGPEHEVYLRPFSVTEVPASGLGVPTPSSSSEPPADNDPEEDLPPELRGRGRKATTMQRELMKEFLSREESLAGLFTSELVDLFVELGESCASAFRELGPKSLKAVGDDEALVNRIMSSAGVNNFNDVKLRPAFEKQYARVLDDTLSTVNRVAGLNVNLTDEAARKIIVSGGTRSGLVDVTNSTRQAIFRALAESHELGEGPAAAARRIRDQVPAGRFGKAGPQYRSKLIARTETKYAQNKSAMEAYRRSEAVTGLLAFDAQGAGESDPECEARNGQTFTFAEAEVELDHEHPGGTLSFAPVI